MVVVSCVIISVLITGLAMVIYSSIEYHDTTHSFITLPVHGFNESNEPIVPSTSATHAQITTRSRPYPGVCNVKEDYLLTPKEVKNYQPSFYFCDDRQSSCDKYGQPVRPRGLIFLHYMLTTSVTYIRFCSC